MMRAAPVSSPLASNEFSSSQQVSIVVIVVDLDRCISNSWLDMLELLVSNF